MDAQPQAPVADRPRFGRVVAVIVFVLLMITMFMEEDSESNDAFNDISDEADDMNAPDNAEPSDGPPEEDEAPIPTPTPIPQQPGLGGTARDNALPDLVRFINSQDLKKVQELLKVIPKVDISGSFGGGGCVVFRAVDRPETEISVEILRSILQHPYANPNGSPSAWTPLKMALSRRSIRMVNALLAHPKVLAEVTTHGLSCDIVGMTPERVAFVVEPAAVDPRTGRVPPPSCFHRHPNLVQRIGSAGLGGHEANTPIISLSSLLPAWKPWAIIAAIAACSAHFVALSTIGILVFSQQP